MRFAFIPNFKQPSPFFSKRLTVPERSDRNDDTPPWFWSAFKFALKLVAIALFLLQRMICFHSLLYLERSSEFYSSHMHRPWNSSTLFVGLTEASLYMRSIGICQISIYALFLWIRVSNSCTTRSEIRQPHWLYMLNGRQPMSCVIYVQSPLLPFQSMLSLKRSHQPPCRSGTSATGFWLPFCVSREEQRGAVMAYCCGSSVQDNDGGGKCAIVMYWAGWSI